MKVFIPATDEALFGENRPESGLVPYQVGVPCFHWQIVRHHPDGEQAAVNESQAAHRTARRSLA